MSSKNNQCWDSYNYNICIPLPRHGQELYVHFPLNLVETRSFCPRTIYLQTNLNVHQLEPRPNIAHFQKDIPGRLSSLSTFSVLKIRQKKSKKRGTLQSLSSTLAVSWPEVPGCRLRQGGYWFGSRQHEQA